MLKDECLIAGVDLTFSKTFTIQNSTFDIVKDEADEQSTISHWIQG
jgi:hypothetical protein